MPKVTSEEHAAIDLMDAYLQLLLALTWQHSQSDGLKRLVALRKQVVQKIDASPHVFKSERERSIATMHILNSLQDARRCPVSDRSVHPLHQWTTSPSSIDLHCLHRQCEDNFSNAVAELVSAARIRMESRVARQDLTNWIGRAICAMAEDLGIPLYVPALADLIVYLASQPGYSPASDLHTELSRYQQLAERLSENKNLIIRSQIVAELRPLADDISLRIDRSYAWAELASFTKETSLKALGLYTQLNLHGRIKDGRFSHNIMRKEAMPSVDFERVFNPFFVRGLTFLMSGDDSDTRQMRHRIVDTERVDVRVNGRRVSDSLMLLVPCEDREFDMERQLALLLLRLDKDRRSRHGNPDKSAPFFESLSPDLHQLIENHGVRRKLIHTKKKLLFCLAGLVAENVYQYREQHSTFLSAGRPLKTRVDADEHTVALLRESGFHYKSETLRRGRPLFRRNFLDRVPTIFGLDESEPDVKSFDQ